ncbi:hypothetical protein [Flavobacterium ginsengiterrae]|uniref:Uncharacterized protein n=1 Tax=Flavobacterium ginsengiterrae TaxID=871695 RepID=A0ABP7H7K8_9FLAO
MINMLKKTIIIIISFFYFPAISQNVKQDSCQLFFKEIGIRDFVLGSNYKDFLKDSKALKRKFKKEKIYGIDIVTFKENIILLKERRKIMFNLKFKQNILMAYDFEINIGNFRTAPDFYNRILKSLNKSKNYFIQGKSHSYMTVSEKCSKNFGLNTEKDASFLYGGISYESPIWEQQFKDYIEEIEQKQ